MLNRFYSPNDAINYLAKDCKISEINRTISFRSGDLGIKKLGAIDYLVNYHNFRVVIQ